MRLVVKAKPQLQPLAKPIRSKNPKSKNVSPKMAPSISDAIAPIIVVPNTTIQNLGLSVPQKLSPGCSCKKTTTPIIKNNAGRQAKIIKHLKTKCRLSNQTEMFCIGRVISSVRCVIVLKGERLEMPQQREKLKVRQLAFLMATASPIARLTLKKMRTQPLRRFFGQCVIIVRSLTA